MKNYKALKDNEAILIVMAAEHNARLTMIENGLDFQDYDNQDLLDSYIENSIIGTLSSEKYSEDVIAEFASIGIEA
jgi:hypothetical protein